jgi:inner membrane protein
MSSLRLSFRIWMLTNLIFAIGFIAVNIYNGEYSMLAFVFVAIVVSVVASLPALVVLLILLPFIKRKHTYPAVKWQLLLLLVLLTCLPYGILAGGLDIPNDFVKAFETCMLATGALFACNAIAIACSYKQINSWVYSGALLPAKKMYPRNPLLQASAISNPSFSHLKTNTDMTPDESFYNDANDRTTPQNSSGYNRTLIKAIITAVLILAMLIPVAYITNLVQEREQRHREVVKEVSDKWAAVQTVTTPYLCIPYLKAVGNETGKQVLVRKNLFLPATSINVKADMQPEIRKRSIYNVLLYKSNINVAGNFAVKPTNDIPVADLILNEARLCIGISDLKGMEENTIVKLNDASLEMEPMLPAGAIDKSGLSVPVSLVAETLAQPLSFSINIKIKGSEQLHFLPASDNSQFDISSSWPNPSFDGSSLPKERTVTKDGFTAKWSFNKANMPLLGQLANTDVNRESLAFGVSMVQPADQYAKTNRSVKYAVLFIGLTFAMFFIIELMQKKQVHPVQYILVGVALAIFYTLLLSIGEFTGFNIAYAIAAAATVLLIGSYTKSMFSSIKTSVLLSAFLGALYGFIYVLIQLEDTALLAGSIGLFVLLAIAMHFSKKINWYANTSHANPAIA